MKKLNYLLVILFGLLMLTSCAPDIENNNYNIIWPWGNNSGYFEKTGSNLIVNVGENNYGEKTRALTRANIETSNIIVNSKDQINTPSIGLYNNYVWNSYDNNSTIYTGTSAGYLFATTSLTCPFKNTWSTTSIIDNGELTLTSVSTGEENTSDTYGSKVLPSQVVFWGNHSLVTSDTKKDIYNTTDTDWKDEVVSKNTQSVAISKAIEYANSGAKINLDFGTECYLAWYDHHSTAKEGQTTILITSNNIDQMPTSEGTWSLTNLEDVAGNPVNIKDGDFKQVSHLDIEEGRYLHFMKGRAIKVIENSSSKTAVWHFIGDDEGDDLNFKVSEIRLGSSASCVYRADYTYTPSEDKANYVYQFNEEVKSGEYATLPIMPTANTSSLVVLKCEVTKYPTDERERFKWYIKKTIDSDVLVNIGAKHSVFYIIGKISTDTNTQPKDSPYSKTWNKGIYCPDVITNVTVHIDDLTVEGGVVQDPDGSDSSSASSLLYNYDWNYGEMTGIWSIGYTKADR